MPQTICDFSAYITERTRDFTSREWVFAEIDRWIADPNASRYLIIIGEPWIGKAAFLSCVGENAYVFRSCISTCCARLRA